jgi:hypothetical protein
MLPDAPMADILLKGLTGACWSAVYILIITRAIRDGFVGLPLISVWLNITWEFTFSFITPDPSLQRYVNMAWFGLDAVILYLAWRYRQHYAPFINKRFIMMSAIAILTAAAVILLLREVYSDARGTYSAYILNTIMSFLFIRQLLQHGPRGQSLSIAWLKMVGTLAPTYLCYITYTDAHFLHMMGVAIFILDAVYCALLRNRIGTLNNPPIDGSGARRTPPSTTA